MRMFYRLAVGFLVFAVFGGFTVAERAGLTPGLYAVTYHLELPHLERYAMARSVRYCLKPEMDAGTAPLPVLGAKTAFLGCAVSPVVREAMFPSDPEVAKLHWDIVCEGRAAARARASYRVIGDRFAGRIAIVLGAKNMTMTEVQIGHRIGPCG